MACSASDGNCQRTEHSAKPVRANGFARRILRRESFPSKTVFGTHDLPDFPSESHGQILNAGIVVVLTLENVERLAHGPGRDLRASSPARMPRRAGRWRVDSLLKFPFAGARVIRHRISPIELPSIVLPHHGQILTGGETGQSRK
jgi:hypothetical protein